MTLCDLLEALAVRGSHLVAEGDRLRHIGPRFATGDPVRRALATFHDEVLWLLVSARLCANCPRMLADSDQAHCKLHQLTLGGAA